MSISKRDSRVTTEMHNCAGLKGMWAPMVEITGMEQELRKNSMRLRAVEREDYEGKDRLLRRDGEGRPIMAVHVDREDGSNDCFVMAPTATNYVEV